ncbi:MAG: energy transducer TonB [Bacteroidales bacterium]|jgi:protein TonB|nr:energy transducer TonB [Bacteroidales bacterium]
MKRNLLKIFFAVSIALLSTLGLNAQTHNDNTIYTFGDLDEYAEYPGGKQGIREFLVANIVIPQEVIAAEAFCTVYVDYVVEKDGSVSNISINNPSNDYYVKLCEEAAMEAVKKLKNFTPAKIGGNTVRSKYTVPVGVAL